METVDRLSPCRCPGPGGHEACRRRRPNRVGLRAGHSLIDLKRNLDAVGLHRHQGPSRHRRRYGADVRFRSGETFPSSRILFGGPDRHFKWRLSAGSRQEPWTSHFNRHVIGHGHDAANAPGEFAGDGPFRIAGCFTCDHDAIINGSDLGLERAGRPAGKEQVFHL
jgi:hypothetical protein